MKKILYIISALLLLVSCAKDLDQVDSGSTAPTGDYKISVSTNADTKVDIDGAVVKWAEGDFIYLAEVGEDEKFNELHTFYIDSESISEDGKSADFYGETLEVGKQYLAVNGGFSWLANDSEWSQELGIDGSLGIGSANVNQECDSSDYHIEAAWQMISPSFEVEEDSTPQIGFTNLSSYLDLNLLMASDVDEECSITNVSFTAPTLMFLSTLYLNSSSDIIYSYSTNTLTLTLNDEPTLSSKEDYRACIPFLANGEITDVVGDFTITIYTSDNKESSVTVPAKLLTENKVYTKELEFPAPVDMVSSDRAALIDFYNSTDGDNWTNKDNWCTDAPLSDWYGVTTDNNGRVSQLVIESNNAVGSIPESIGNLTNLVYLSLYCNFTGAIPESIANLDKLQSCFLGYNITGSIPEAVGNMINLTSLRLQDVCISGEIPTSLANLTNLEQLAVSGQFYDNCTYFMVESEHLSGEIPDIFGDMKNLHYLDFSFQNLSGSVPSSIANATTLTHLYLEFNQLEGSIDFLANLSSLEYLNLAVNNFSGTISDEVTKNQYWNKWAWTLYSQNSGYGFDDFPDVYLEPSNLVTIDGEAFNTEDLFKANKLTCVVEWATWCSFSATYLATLKDLYKAYGSDGFEIIAMSDEDESTIKNYVEETGIPGKVCKFENITDYSDGTNHIKYMLSSVLPSYNIVDSEGKIVASNLFFPFDCTATCSEEVTIAFLEEYFGEPATSTEDYESTDYTKDGEVVTLQTATVGDGINLVIVGDGFIDTHMESGGKYETRMSEAMEHFFSEEPYATYRDRYNVYAIKAVSKNSGVNGVSETAFSSQFGDGTFIWGDDTKVFEYALKVPNITTTDNLTVIAVLNSSAYAGTCYMYTNDAAVAYCPIVSYDDEQFRQIVVHEAGGHGFAKLLDEYAYEGTIPASDIEAFEWQNSLGWGANVDVTSDRSEIQWAHMLSDSRYDGLVDVYEGALTYEFGAYRPTDVSIMRYNTGGYNPPSRQEIYRRIMVLSGDTFDYEEFVTYDAINRTASAQRQAVSQAYQVDKSKFVPLAKPVVVKGSSKVSK